MLIAVISDLHDNTVAWQQIVKYLESQKITRLINCGDTCAPAMLEEMSKTFSGQIDTVFGNVADRDLELNIVKKLSNVNHLGDHGEVKIDDKNIYFVHQPVAAEKEAKTGKYDLVCYGHTHLKRWELIGKTLILNPGTAGGMFQYPSFATVDLKTMKCSFIDITL